MAKPKKSIDWKAVERDYTKTALPVRELARWYNCDEKAIRLRAKAEGWVRPGAETPQPAPQSPQPLDALVAPIVERLRELAPDEPATTPDIVERARRVTLRLVDELEAVTTRKGELGEMIDEALAGKDNAKQRESLRKALSLSERATVLKNIALTTKTLAEAQAPAGKKAAAAEDAKSAGLGSDWGDDLAMPDARPN
ncbi:hypothetical protein [Methylorubrum salsuginis]|uniref:Terminase small subunit n=1 Tax=Methylorubrum salsuginis TaxID=414703 RepID=A0A1I4FMZ9_9HYPH|nr:hypothetical protein [Methylorubrum salsuginis]SFL18317.1 hypothetical protein SAMN04488125_11085 [Methylorubrum salsuginis]